MADFIEQLHALDFAGKREYTEGLIRQYKFICLDEIDKFGITDYTERTVFKFLDKGLSAMCRFMFGANLDKQGLLSKLDANIMSRILGDCLIVENKGEVLR